MKISWVFLLLLMTVFYPISLVSAMEGDPPVLVGKWAGTSVGHMKYGGYGAPSLYTYQLDITDQNNRTFNGSIYTTLRGKTHKIGFSGVIGRNLKSFFLTEYEGGIDFGEIISSDEIELIYLEDGNQGMALLETFFREKE